MDRTSVLDRDRAALVVVDIQERLAITMARRDTVIARTRLLIAVAGIVGMPVVVTRQYPRGLGETEPLVSEAIAQVEAAGVSVTHVDKVAFDCFREPEFLTSIESMGRDQLLVCGMETHICITQTALSALRRGLEVHVAADGCCSREEENRHFALSRLQAAGAIVTTAESAAYELVGLAGTDEFKSLLHVVKNG